jgi:hypothetical protein
MAHLYETIVSAAIPAQPYVISVFGRDIRTWPRGPAICVAAINEIAPKNSN